MGLSSLLCLRSSIFLVSALFIFSSSLTSVHSLSPLVGVHPLGTLSPFSPPTLFLRVCFGPLLDLDVHYFIPISRAYISFCWSRARYFWVSLFIGSKVPSFYPFPDLLTDEKYYGAEVITCKDGSGSFTRDRLNDNFCDCFDGTDEPGNLPITFTIFHFITEIWMACIYFLYCSVSTPGSFPTSMESLSWLWMS